MICLKASAWVLKVRGCNIINEHDPFDSFIYIKVVNRNFDPNIYKIIYQIRSKTFINVILKIMFNKL